MKTPLKEEIPYKEKSRTSRTNWRDNIKEKVFYNRLKISNISERCLKVRGNQSSVRKVASGNVESWNALGVSSLGSLPKAHTYLLSG